LKRVVYNKIRINNLNVRDTSLGESGIECCWRLFWWTVFRTSKFVTLYVTGNCAKTTIYSWSKAS